MKVYGTGASGGKKKNPSMKKIFKVKKVTKKTKK